MINVTKNVRKSQISCDDGTMNEPNDELKWVVLNSIFDVLGWMKFWKKRISFESGIFLYQENPITFNHSGIYFMTNDVIIHINQFHYLNTYIWIM